MAEKYAVLKRELAGQHREDREGHTRAKTAFVQEITAMALQAIAESKETIFDGMSH